ncbi:hypothetical protein [Chelativorans sp. AA-79]|uniref:hypothetical protein n=1 Tax=Chelativorans sp. AA-79 TaxID=3028735 RepID=UPI0023F68D89|nr:hypothetical protein [Chelativorans sp. AA-79]WEX11875.1 hypothetical protein PVE73_11275 [Chelativorans sp. AA-79]
MSKYRLYPMLGFLVAAGALPAAAQGDGNQPSLSIELNGAEPSERGCRLTFVAANRLGQDIARAAYEVALFGKDGLVERLTILDFKELPDAETKVRQFDMPEIDCANLGRVLINGATACEGPDASACMKRLEATTRGAVAFGK